MLEFGNLFNYNSVIPRSLYFESIYGVVLMVTMSIRLLISTADFVILAPLTSA